MGWRLGALAALAVTHLVLVTLGAFRLASFASRPPLAPLGTYMELSGASNDYSFFAPSVGSQIRARFVVRHPDRITVSTFETPNHEVNQRINSLVTASQKIPELQQAFARSWAAAVLGRNPDARHTVVLIERHQLPTMAEYRAGARPDWVVTYRGDFERVDAGR
jgi:hypothetical protein